MTVNGQQEGSFAAMAGHDRTSTLYLEALAEAELREGTAGVRARVASDLATGTLDVADVPTLLAEAVLLLAEHRRPRTVRGRAWAEEARVEREAEERS